jgi:hypothetical protein
MVTSFEESERHRLPGDITEAGIAGFLDEKLENENFFYTLRVDGTFGSTRRASACSGTFRRPSPTWRW